MWYRVWVTSRLQSSQAQHWLSTWLPPQACGGCKGRSLHDALVPLLRGADKGKFLVSLDFSQAFDMCKPDDAVWLLQRLGLPQSVAGILLSAWTEQRRYLEYQNCVLDIPESVTASLPQGDPGRCSALLRSSPLRPVTSKTRSPEPCSGPTSTTAVGRQTRATRRWQPHQSEWAAWSRLMGLKGNMEKTQYYHHSAKGRREFLDAGRRQDRDTDQPCALGCHLQGLVRRSCNDKERERLQTAANRIRKLSMLPVPKDAKQALAASAALSKAEHGWYHKLPAQSNFRIVEAAVDQLCKSPSMLLRT